MNNWKSWRLSHLNGYSAWNCLMHAEGIVSCICVLICVFILFGMSWTQENTSFIALIIFSIIIFLNIIFSYMFGAYKTISFEQDSKVQKIYIYQKFLNNKLDGYKLIVVTPKAQKIYLADNYLYQDNSFVFCPHDDNKLKLWMMITPKDSEPLILGRQICRNVFVLPQRKDDKIVLRVLKNGSFMTYFADRLVSDKIFIPEETKNTIETNTHRKIEQLPQDYLLLQNAGEYIILGCYHKDIFDCQKLNIPALIFKDGIETIVLVFDGCKYEELFRSKNCIDVLSSVIVTIQTKEQDKKLSATIYHLDADNLVLDTLYTGPVLWIDYRHGEILTEDAQTFRLK